MSNSSLVTYTRLSPNRTSPRTGKIDTVTIHCTAGNKNNTAKQIADLGNFVNAGGSSCNYAVGGDGSISLIVDEKNRSWCSSSGSNDHRAITIEVASTNFHPYEVTPAAYEGLIKLLVDICQRNSIKELIWKADKNLIGQPAKQNMTVHRWFANKACPGEYLYERHGQIAKDVNARLKPAPAPPTPNPSPTISIVGEYKVQVTAGALNYRAGPAASFPVKGVIRDKGVYTIVEEKNGWGLLQSGQVNKDRWISLKYTKKV